MFCEVCKLNLSLKQNLSKLALAKSGSFNNLLLSLGVMYGYLTSVLKFEPYFLVVHGLMFKGIPYVTLVSHV